MSAPFAWPALQPCAVPETIAYERAVWGKVHAAASDFRWIAKSRAFGQRHSRLERQFALSSEDEPRRAVFWRCLEASYFAGVCYPSRAVDAAGRQGFLEKQLLEWTPYDLPAALGALLLLAQAAPLADELWWNRYQDKPWSEPEFALSVADNDHSPLLCSPARLSQAIQDGLEALRAEVEQHSLQAFYAQLLSGRRPALLRGLSQPLSAQALAALLLPLPRAQADRLSLAAWLPSRRFSLDELGGRWDGLVIPPEYALREAPLADSAFLEQARRIAEALLSGAPERLPPFSAKTDTVSLRYPDPLGNHEAQLGIDKTGAALDLASDTVSIGIDRTGAAPHPADTLSLPQPDPNAPSFIQELYTFANTVNRRWLDPAQRPSELPAPLNNGRLLCTWVERGQAGRPHYADKAQWRVKVDLLRALAILLAPCPETFNRVGLPTSGRIPALLFAVHWLKRRTENVHSLR